MKEKRNPSKDAGLKSPGSFMGSSIQSHQLSALSVEEGSSVNPVSPRNENPNWRLGMPWIVGGSQSQTFHDPGSPGNNVSEEPQYYGGLMKAEGQLSPAQGFGKKSGWMLRSTSKSSRNPRKRTGGTPGDDMSQTDSLASFHESEWTPQDSAYGAACPVCGCIPKHVRRMIEFSLIAIMVVGFVWILVATSIQVTNARKDAMQSNSTDYHNGQMIAVDDDFYVEVTNDDLMVDDEANLYDDMQALDDDRYALDDNSYVSSYGDDRYYGGRWLRR